MDFYPLAHFIEPSLLNTSIVVAESLSCNADFIIPELHRHRFISTIATYYQTTLHYSQLCKHFNTKPPSILEYPSEIPDSALVDDFYSALKFGAHVETHKNAVCVFRSGTCTESDFYRGSLVIELGPLDSGVSRELDGRMTIFSREDILCDVKYKVKGHSVVYTT